MIRGAITINLDMTQVGMNLSESSHHLQPGEAVLVQNIDFDDNRGAIVGRNGSITVNTTTGFTYPTRELYRAINPLTGDKYLLVASDKDATPTKKKLYFLKTSGTPDTSPTEIETFAGATFELNPTARLSFATAYDTTLGKTVVWGTNGVDQPVYWDFNTHGITPFTFGSAGTTRLKTFLPYAWQGRLWAWGLNNEVHYSDPDNFTHWVDEGIAGFLDADAQNYQNPPRACEVLRDRLIVFSLDSIGLMNPTNDTDVPFEYVPIVREHGTLAQRTIQPWDSNVLFIDKRSPYLFMFTGNQIIPLDPDGKMSNGFEQFVDASDILNTKLSLQSNNLCICFKSRVDSTDPGAVGDRWLATVNLRRQNNAGVPSFPWSMYPIQANDIVFGQEGTDIGSTWFTDAEPRVDGKYYVHRFTNLLTAAANRYGDYNGVSGNETNVTSYLRTGWMDFAYLMQAMGKRVAANLPFRALRFFIDGDYEGTPAAGDTCKVQYRFNGWTAWRDLPVASVKMAQWAPFDSRAYGREIQFQIVFSSKTARPILYRLGIDILPLRGYMR